MLQLALPLALTQLVAIAIHITDTVMMGWLGPWALAAGALGMNVYMPLWLFALGIVTAVAALAAQSHGAGDDRGVRRSVRQGLWVAAVVSVPAGLVIWHGGAILTAFRQDPATVAETEAYLRVLVWSFPSSLGLIVLRCFVSALARTRTIMITMVLGFFFNILGNYALMFGHFGFPRLELVGAAITSVLVYSGMFLGLVAYLQWAPDFRRYALLVRFWRADWARFREIFRIGLPIGASIVAETMLFSAAAFLMGLISVDTLAAHAIAMQCVMAAFMLPLGISHAATIRVGLAAGADDGAGIGRAGWVGLGLGLMIMLAVAAVFLSVPYTLIGFFLDLDLAESGPVAAQAATLLAVAALFQVFDGAQVIAQGALRGLRDTRQPMIYAVCGYWGVGFPACALLAFGLGLGGPGIWLGLAIGLALVSALLVRRFRQQERRLCALDPAAAPAQ